MSEQATTTERIEVKGEHLVARVKELIHEGNVQRIVINDADGKHVLDMPVTFGVIGLLLAPSLTAIGTLGALASCYSIDIERQETKTTEPNVIPNLRSGDIQEERIVMGNMNTLERYVASYKERDLDAIMELYAEDAVQGMPDGKFEGRSAIRDRLAKELVAFPDVDFGYTSYVEQGDAFADEWWFEGTHTGPFALPDGTELAPTGKRVQMKGMEFVQLRDGKIVVDNLYYDTSTIATQLGLLPEGAPATAT